MSTRTFDECKKALEKSDKNTLEARAKRLQELPEIQTYGRLFSSQRESDYSAEASDSYINGNYRSAIFCCACAVDQILRYEYLKVPGNTLEDLEHGVRTFGQIIGSCRNGRIKSVSGLVKQADLLNNIRNRVAAHPLFTDFPIRSDKDKQVRTELLLKGIVELLDIIGRLDQALRRNIESTELVLEAEGETYVLGDVIKQQNNVEIAIHGFLILVEERILRFLAVQAWSILKGISEKLYGVND